VDELRGPDDMEEPVKRAELDSPPTEWEARGLCAEHCEGERCRRGATVHHVHESHSYLWGALVAPAAKRQPGFTFAREAAS
jgi:hypothetical protein